MDADGISEILQRVISMVAQIQVAQGYEYVITYLHAHYSMTS